jgi:hypothetical protein
MIFEIGELVDIIADFSGMHPETIGEECIIVEQLAPRELSTGEFCLCWVAVMEDAREGYFRPGELRKKKPPKIDDGRDVTTWDEDVLGAPAPWRPKKEVAC